MLPPPVAAAEKRNRKTKTGGSAGASLLFTLLGLGCLLLGVACFLFFVWPLGLLIIVGGLVLIAAGTLVDAKYRTDHFCSACGNDVGPTSQLCPTCHAGFQAVGTPISKGDQRKATILFLVVVVPIVLLLVWIMSKI